MLLESLRMERKTYGADEGKVTGRARFSGKDGAVEIVLSDEKCRTILQVCAMQIVDTAKQVSRDLTAECVDGYAMLERESA
jgi:hypothetical protein